MRRLPCSSCAAVLTVLVATASPACRRARHADVGPRAVTATALAPPARSSFSETDPAPLGADPGAAFWAVSYGETWAAASAFRNAPPLPWGPGANVSGWYAPRAPRLARHVIIISEDGLRPDALVQANGTVHGSVMQEGAYSLQAMTIRHASTLPSHAAMLSGFDEPAHKLSWNSWRPERGFIQVPTVFDAAMRAGDGSAAFVGKQKLEHIAHPGSVDVFSRPGYLCRNVVPEAAQYFVDKRPEIEFIHFSDPDEQGHAEGWMSEPQLAAIRETDRCLATLLDAVRGAHLETETLLILSADHGGHGHNHTGRIKEDRLIPWIAWGVGVRRGHRIEAAINTMDTAATALWALGYPAPPEIEGRPVMEAFRTDLARAEQKL